MQSAAPPEPSQAPAPLVGTGAALSVKSVTKRFTRANDTPYTAVADVSFEVEAGSFVALVGPSGCGKSTVLDVMAGLSKPAAGSVEVDGRPLRGLNKRAVYMAQQDTLLPWRTVRDNVSLGPRLRGGRGAAVDELVDAWLARVGLAAFADAYPSQLSGGMRKRVAIAQTWIVGPDIVLMDEPLGSVDVHTRQHIESELLAIWETTGTTAVLVTHDLEEAVSLADRVVVFSAGPASHIVAVHDVDLPRPRDLMDLKMDDRFVALYRDIWQDLRREVLRSHEHSDRSA